MILILSHDGDEHARAVRGELERRGALYHQFDLARFPRHRSLVFHCNGTERQACLLGEDQVDLSDCRVAWWRRPQPFQLDPAIQDPDDAGFAYNECHEAVTGLWQVLDCFWINDPVRDECAARKLYQLDLARRLGLRIPDTCITSDPDAARAFIVRHPQVIYKTFSATRRAWRETRLLRPGEHELLDQVRHAPVIFQEYVPPGADLRITMVGGRIFTGAIDVRGSGYEVDFRMVMDEAPTAIHELPDGVARLLRTLMAELGLVYGAIDMRLTPEGEYVFLEVNPAGQWLFVEGRTGLPITAAIAELMMERDRSPVSAPGRAATA